MGIKKLVVAAMSAGFIMSVASFASLADSDIGWRDNGQGDWRYFITVDEYLKDCWKKDNGKWYYLYSDGVALKDQWAYIDGKLYYFNSSGAMETDKWIECGDIELPDPSDYLSENDRILLTDEYAGKKDYRYVDSTGAAVIGWQKIDGDWYYFNPDKHYNNGREMGKYGLMTYGWLTENNGSNYCFDGSGKMITDSWVENSNGHWWYFGTDGAAYKRWNKIDGNWYYFKTYGEGYLDAATGWDWTYEPSTDEYGICLFDEDGRMLGKGWHQYEGDWYYTKSNGYLLNGEWLDLNGVKYYFDYNGVLVSGKNDFFVDGWLYNFNAGGACTNYATAKKVDGWYQVSGQEKRDLSLESDYWVYVVDGTVVEHCWKNIKGSWYYFGWDGAMYSDINATIDGKRYEFDKNGNCVNPYPNYRGWHQEESDYGFDSWYYYDSNGNVLTGWHQIGNYWYYFDETGFMYEDGLYSFEDGNEYYFDKNGRMLTGWIKYYNSDNIEYSWFYADSDGSIAQTGWKSINGNWYYFNYGFMMTYGYYIDDKGYDFGTDGICKNPYNPDPMPVVLLKK